MYSTRVSYVLQQMEIRRRASPLWTNCLNLACAYELKTVWILLSYIQKLKRCRSRYLEFTLHSPIFTLSDPEEK